MEKCYRDIQSRGQIAGLSLLEVFILIGVPLLLFPIFTLLKLSFGIILIIEVVLYTLFRLTARMSPFDYGLASFVFSKFVWQKQLSAYVLDEKSYIKDETPPSHIEPKPGSFRDEPAIRVVTSHGKPKPGNGKFSPRKKAMTAGDRKNATSIQME